MRARRRAIRGMSTFRWFVTAGSLAFACFGTLAGAAWYRSTSSLKLAVPPGNDTVKPFLQRLASDKGRVSIELVPVADNRAALEALRTGKAQLASVRVDEDASGDIRAVALLSSRYLVQVDGPPQTDPDLAYAREQLSSAIGKPLGITGMDVRAARRLESAPKGVVTRAGLKMSEEQAEKVWFLGAGRDEPEEADDWRGRTLLLSRMLVTSEKVDRQVIHDVAMSVTDIARVTRADTPAAREVALAPIDEGKSVLRAHDGIARFVNREGQGFFERYGDLVYVGMSVLGIVLTAVGGLLAWLRYRMADNGRRHLSRMQVLVRWASSRPGEAERVKQLAALIGIHIARDVARRRVAYDVLGALEVLQRTLGLVLADKNRALHLLESDARSPAAQLPVNP